jgi:hypothetical protein
VGINSDEVPLPADCDFSHEIDLSWHDSNLFVVLISPTQCWISDLIWDILQDHNNTPHN